MVYSDSIQQFIYDRRYKNEHFRSKHGYKEEFVHARPHRKNRDFKPIHYGDFVGLPNYKHSEHFCHLKNTQDVFFERDNFAVRWGKAFIGGALFGAGIAPAFFAIPRMQYFPVRKLFERIGDKPMSFRSLKFLKIMIAPFAMQGGMLGLSYALLQDFFHHTRDESTNYPKVLDWIISWTLIGGGFTALKLGPKYLIQGAFFWGFMVSPGMWLLKTNGFDKLGGETLNYAYINEMSEEDIHRVQVQDRIEALGYEMASTYAYGYSSMNDKWRAE